MITGVSEAAVVRLFEPTGGAAQVMGEDRIREGNAVGHEVVVDGGVGGQVPPSVLSGGHAEAASPVVVVAHQVVRFMGVWSGSL